MAYWWIDRTLPGVAASAIWALAIWLSHRKLRGHLVTVIAQQDERIKQLITDQTATLAGRNTGGSH